MNLHEMQEQLEEAMLAVRNAGFHNGELDFEVSEEAEALIMKLAVALGNASICMSALKEISETIDGVRNSLDDTDNLALGLVSGDFSEKEFLENYNGIVADIERVQDLVDVE